MAHKFAYESPHVSTEAISAPIMLDLAQAYQVRGTPHTVINGQHHQPGSLSEATLWAAIKRATYSIAER